MKRSFIMAIALLLMSFNFVYASSYTDLENEKCESFVIKLSEQNIINGYEDGTFRPNNNVTRAEACKILATAYKLSRKDSNITFSDIKGHWAEKYIELMSENGIINGYPDGTFGPNKNISYAEFLTLCIRLVENNSTKDWQWPADYIEKAFKLHLLDNVENMEYNNNATRGNIAIIIYNLLNQKTPNEVVSGQKYLLVVDDITKNSISKENDYEVIGYDENGITRVIYCSNGDTLLNKNYDDEYMCALVVFDAKLKLGKAYANYIVHLDNEQLRHDYDGCQKVLKSDGRAYQIASGDSEEIIELDDKQTRDMYAGNDTVFAIIYMNSDEKIDNAKLVEYGEINIMTNDRLIECLDNGNNKKVVFVIRGY